MIKRKNILAENMLRFRSKNIAAEEAAAIRKLIEAQTADTAPYKNPTDIDGFFTVTKNEAMVLAPRDAKTVIFATTLKPDLSEYAAKSGNTHAIKLPGTNFYLAVGQIGIVDNNVNPSVNSEKPGAILFYAIEQKATEPYGRIIPKEFIPYAVNTGDLLDGLAKFASDIIRGTKPGPTQKADYLAKLAPRIAAVFKAAVDLSISGADQLNDTKYYDKWLVKTNKYLAGPAAGK